MAIRWCPGRARGQTGAWVGSALGEGSSGRGRKQFWCTRRVPPPTRSGAVSGAPLGALETNRSRVYIHWKRVSARIAGSNIPPIPQRTQVFICGYPGVGHSESLSLAMLANTQLCERACRLRTKDHERRRNGLAGSQLIHE